jgi:hypothetical protein
MSLALRVSSLDLEYILSNGFDYEFYLVAEDPLISSTRDWNKSNKTSSCKEEIELGIFCTPPVREAIRYAAKGEIL